MPRRGAGRGGRRRRRIGKDEDLRAALWICFIKHRAVRVERGLYAAGILVRDLVLRAARDVHHKIGRVFIGRQTLVVGRGRQRDRPGRLVERIVADATERPGRRSGPHRLVRIAVEVEQVGRGARRVALVGVAGVRVRTGRNGVAVVVGRIVAAEHAVLAADLRVAVVRDRRRTGVGNQTAFRSFQIGRAERSAVLGVAQTFRHVLQRVREGGPGSGRVPHGLVALVDDRLIRITHRRLVDNSRVDDQLVIRRRCVIVVLGVCIGMERQIICIHWCVCCVV